MASSARIDELRKKFDENPRRYFAPLANEYRKAGDAEQAIFICQEYLPQQPGHMSGHIVYGQALFELDRHEEARAVFETALSLDPENLIALRHLGDIARMAGDATTARVWYQRVLEADPRNEEIAQIMLSLLSSEPLDTRSARSSAPTPLTNPAVSGTSPDSVRAVPSAPAPGAESGLNVEKSEEASLDSVAPAAPTATTHPVTPAMSAPTVAEARHVSPHAPKEADLLDLDDFDLGGVPLSELRAASPTPVYQPAQPFDGGSASGIDLPPMIDAEGVHTSRDADEHANVGERGSNSGDDSGDDTDSESVVSEHGTDGFSEGFTEGLVASTPGVDHEAPAPSSFEPTIHLASDLHLGLPDDSAASSLDVTADSNSAMDGLETFEAGVFTSPAGATESLATESFFETTPAPDDHTSRIDASLDVDAATESEAFVESSSAFASGYYADSAQTAFEPSQTESSNGERGATDGTETAGSEAQRSEAKHSESERSEAEPSKSERSEFEPSSGEPSEIAHSQSGIAGVESRDIASEGTLSNETRFDDVGATDGGVAETWLDEARREDAPLVETSLTESAADTEVADSPFADAPFAAAPFAEGGFTEAAIVDEAFGGQTFAHEAPADKPLAGETFADEAFADESFADEAFADEAFADADFRAHGHDATADLSAASPSASHGAQPVEAFVTETMAELYLEQGHLDSALDIYRKLVEQRPDDASLAERMRAVEDRVFGAASLADVTERAAAAAEDADDADAAAHVAPARSFGGPTIREFLSGLARKTPGYFADASNDAAQSAAQDIAPEFAHGFAHDAARNPADDSGADWARQSTHRATPRASDGVDESEYYVRPSTDHTDDGIDEPFAGESSLLDDAIDAPLDQFHIAPSQPNAESYSESYAEPSVQPSAQPRSGTSSHESLSGSLGALFSGAAAAAADAAAANTLAQAFAPNSPETAALEGMPAHRASSELSLDHVFKGNTPTRASGGTDGFSFDQFFSEDAIEGSAQTGSDSPAGAPQGADDIAQFNAWLNGLKKT